MVFTLTDKTQTSKKQSSSLRRKTEKVLQKF